MNILQIDSSSDLCSVAISQDGELLHHEINTESFHHGRDINLLIRALLHKCDLEISNIHAISVNKGPGSYTALRIGMSTAKGLCYGLDIPLITVSGLEILIDHGMVKYPDSDLYIPMIDARRMEVYTCSPTSDLSHKLEHCAKILSAESFKQLASKQVCFIGSGVNKWMEIWPENKSWIGEQVEINAGMMTRISYAKFGTGNFSDLFTSSPSYIKKPNITKSKKQYFN